MGTDSLGRDLFSRIIYGARISLFVGLGTVIGSLIFGSIIGAAAAYYGGKVDNILMRIMDILLAIPNTLLAICIIAAFGLGMTKMILALMIAGIPRFSRIVRSAVMGVKGEEYIEAAKACGTSDSRIIIRHIIPNAMGAIIVQATTQVARTITFSAFDEYWGEPAPVENYIYRIMTDDTTRMMALENGEVDIVYNPTRTDKDYINSIDGLTFESSETAGSWVYVMFNCIDPESNFSDVRTRQAVASAIRREDFVAGAINGLGIEIECPMPPAVTGYDYDFKFWEYDQEKARDLLAEAGYEEGLTETLKTSQQAMVKTTSEILQAQLREVGIELEIEILERATYNTEVLDSMDYKATIWNTIAGVMDADFALYNAYSSFNVGQGQASNNHGATDDHIDDVLTQARYSSDSEERSELYNEVFEWVKETCCRIPLYAPSYNLAYNEDLEGVIPNAVNRYVASFYSWGE